MVFRSDFSLLFTISLPSLFISPLMILVKIIDGNVESTLVINKGILLVFGSFFILLSMNASRTLLSMFIPIALSNDDNSDSMSVSSASLRDIF